MVQLPDRRVAGPLLLRNSVNVVLRCVRSGHLSELGHVHVQLLRVALEADVVHLRSLASLSVGLLSAYVRNPPDSCTHKQQRHTEHIRHLLDLKRPLVDLSSSRRVSSNRRVRHVQVHDRVHRLNIVEVRGVREVAEDPQPVWPVRVARRREVKQERPEAYTRYERNMQNELLRQQPHE